MWTKHSVLRTLKRVLLMTLGLVLAAALGLFAYYLYARPSADLRAAYSVRQRVLHDGHSTGKSADFASVFSEAKRVADKYPGSAGALVALQAAAVCAKSSADTQTAIESYQQELDKSDFGSLAKSIGVGIPPWSSLAPVAAKVLLHVKKNQSHPDAGRVAAAICLMTRPSNGVPGITYREAADLLKDKLASQSDIHHFAESLIRAPQSCEAWSYEFEPHLREILRINNDPFVRCTTMFALAMVLKDQPSKFTEAQQLLEIFCDEFNGTKPSTFQHVEQNYAYFAKSFLEEMRHQLIGMTAIETKGLDLDEKPMDLGELRGKVVFLSFWATWCGPCMKLIPHERKLQNDFAARSFEIVGVNVDSDRQAARAAVKEHNIGWRSFVSASGGDDSIAAKWNVIAYPTCYLIDHHGVIRRRWIDAPAPEQLYQNVDVLVQAAESNTSLNGMNDIMKLLKTDTPVAPPISIDKGLDSDIRKYLFEKDFVDSEGAAHPYVIYRSPNADGSALSQGIIFLHGSGARGETCDHAVANCLPLLANIHRHAPTAPVLVVIPLAHEQESWLAEGSAGTRVFSIMDQMQREYSIDSKKWILTGFSMGGEGTWSLAGASPDRFVAIVPISHGGPKDAIEKLTAIPCWCFHGDADAMISPSQSRSMVQMLTHAGGQPRYTAIPGVGHEEAAQIAYSDPGLLDWMFAQVRSR